MVFSWLYHSEVEFYVASDTANAVIANGYAVVFAPAGVGTLGRRFVAERAPDWIAAALKNTMMPSTTRRRATRFGGPQRRVLQAAEDLD